MERETGIEPAPSAWKAEVLPLNYSREGNRIPGLPLRALPRLSFRTAVKLWWREVDSNHRRRKPADLQSAPVGRLGIPPGSATATSNAAGVKQPAILVMPKRSVNAFLQLFLTSDVEPEVEDVAL